MRAAVGSQSAGAGGRAPAVAARGSLSSGYTTGMAAIGRARAAGAAMAMATQDYGTQAQARHAHCCSLAVRRPLVR